MAKVSSLYYDDRFYTACKQLDIDYLRSTWTENVRRQLEGIRVMLNFFLESLSNAEKCYDVVILYLRNGPKKTTSRRAIHLTSVLQKFISDKRFFSVEHIGFIKACISSMNMWWCLRIPKYVTDRSTMLALLSARQRRVGSLSAIRHLPSEMIRMITEFLWDYNNKNDDDDSSDSDI